MMEPSHEKVANLIAASIAETVDNGPGAIEYWASTREEFEELHAVFTGFGVETSPIQVGLRESNFGVIVPVPEPGGRILVRCDPRHKKA